MKIRQKNFNWGEKTYIMGILNVTPDSFSDGGQFESVENAVNQAREMIAHGVDIIDIGGESTRPGAPDVSLEDELGRVIPVIKGIRRFDQDTPISIDTTKSKVAGEAIAQGADIVNDISGATFDSEMLSVVASLDVPIILMHIRGNPQTMQSLTNYTDLVGEVNQFFQERINEAISKGIRRSHLILDPGIGFAKTYQQNIQLFQQLSAFKTFNLPLLVGPSRKSFIGQILQKNHPQERVWGTAAACCKAIAQGADILRVHDVAAMVDVAKVADVLCRLLKTEGKMLDR
jgi:dihydropteroate synthase